MLIRQIRSARYTFRLPNAPNGPAPRSHASAEPSGQGLPAPRPGNTDAMSTTPIPSLTLNYGRTIPSPASAATRFRPGRRRRRSPSRWRSATAASTRPRLPQRGRDGNLQAVSLRLSDQEMDAIAPLDRGDRVGPDPARFS